MDRNRLPVRYCEIQLYIRGDELLPERFAQQDLLQEFLFVLRRRGQVGIERQAQGESCSSPLLAPGINSPAVMMHDKIAGHQVNAVFHRTVAADHKRIEHQPQGLLGQTRARCR